MCMWRLKTISPLPRVWPPALPDMLVWVSITFFRFFFSLNYNFHILVYTLACLYGIENEEISSIARQGSGSACRSLHSGFVQWQKGEHPDGSDSVAVQLVPHDFWPEMRIIVLVVNDARKKTSSTGGMSTSVKTSKLLKYRVEECVPKHTKDLVEVCITVYNIYREITNILLYT